MGNDKLILMLDFTLSGDVECEVRPRFVRRNYSDLKHLNRYQTHIAIAAYARRIYNYE